MVDLKSLGLIYIVGGVPTEEGANVGENTKSLTGPPKVLNMQRVMFSV